MPFIVLGCLAFGFLFIFDVNKNKFQNKYLNITFALGIMILAGSTIGILWGDFERFEISNAFRLLAGIIAIALFLILIYGLFFALPFNKTYTSTNETNQLIDTGVYALCRHPGVIWFFFLYLCLWIASEKMIMLWAGIIWTIMDVIHVYIQDRWFFPYTFDGYDIYKSRVPFLIPDRVSIRRCLSYYIARNRI